MTLSSDVVIVGAGKLGTLLHDCLHGDDRWRCTAFHDDQKAGSTLAGLPILHTEQLQPGQAAIIAIGDPRTRQSMVERLQSRNVDWRTFIDRRSIVGPGATLGRGTVVLSFAMVMSGVTVGPFCYFSAYSHAGTGSTIGAYSSLLAAASVGESVVGESCVLGLKSVCLDGAVLGDRVVVAPLTLVRRAIPSGALVAGNPARIVSRDQSRTL